jgi:hypothetical protein
MVSVDALTSWWERMPEARRTELLAHRCSPIRPDLALELWHESGWLPVVRPGRWSTDVHRLAWRFAPEVEEFLDAHAPDREQQERAALDLDGGGVLEEAAVRRPAV